MDIETGESSWSSSPTPTLFEVGDDEENTQLKTSIQELHDSCNIQVSTTDQEPESPHSAFSKRTHPDPTQDGHPRIDNNTRVSHPNDFHVQTPAYGQTRSGMPSRDSQEAQSSDLEPNASLHVYEQTDIGQAQATPKMYVMWLGNQSRLGTLPRVHLVIIGLSSLLGFIMLGGFLLLGGPEGLGGLIMSTASSHFMTSRLCGLILGALALVLIFLTFTALYNKYWIEPLYLWLTLTICPTLLGLLTWMCYKINVNNFSLMWDISPIPQSFRGCESRVGPEQLSLFTEDIYKTQFARIVIIAANQTILYLGFDKELSISIQTNQKLCNQGFEGNADLYGLGIRAGIYLQWITSLLANNLLPGERKQLQNVYLVSSLAICIATIVSSFAVPCMFSIEIEILYWMYWGGVLCVCISSPNLLRLGSKSTWIGLDWITAIQFTMHILMVYHGIWFVWYAYDQFFSRMPCGTYHFFLVPFLDPSESYWILRDYLTLLISPIATPLVFAIPLTIFLLVSEIKNSIQDSATYRTFSPKSTNPVDRSDTVLSNPTIQLSLKLRILLRLRRIYRGIRRRYGTLRTAFGLPSHGMRGIRLVTPVDIRDRRNYRIRCAALGIASCAISITAIEMTLKWNKVVGIYSLASIGQWMPLTVGIATFLTVFWQLVEQEGIRQRDIRHRQKISQNVDGIELVPIQGAFTGAVRFAIERADVGFLTNDGALPTSSRDVNWLSDSPRPSDVSHRPSNDYMMSSALAGLPSNAGE